MLLKRYPSHRATTLKGKCFYNIEAVMVYAQSAVNQPLFLMVYSEDLCFLHCTKPHMIHLSYTLYTHLSKSLFSLELVIISISFHLHAAAVDYLLYRDLIKKIYIN